MEWIFHSVVDYKFMDVFQKVWKEDTHKNKRHDVLDRFDASFLPLELRTELEERERARHSIGFVSLDFRHNLMIIMIIIPLLLSLFRLDWFSLHYFSLYVNSLTDNASHGKHSSIPLRVSLCLCIASLLVIIEVIRRMREMRFERLEREYFRDNEIQQRLCKKSKMTQERSLGWTRTKWKDSRSSLILIFRHHALCIDRIRPRLLGRGSRG